MKHFSKSIFVYVFIYLLNLLFTMRLSRSESLGYWSSNSPFGEGKREKKHIVIMQCDECFEKPIIRGYARLSERHQTQPWGII